MPKPSTAIEPPSIAAEWHTTSSRWDCIFLASLAGLLLFLLLSMGAVEAWSQLVVVVVAAAMSFGLLLRLWMDRTMRITPSWCYLPLLAILALIVLQLVPLPSGIVATLNPQTVELREDLIGAPAHTTAATTLSLYSYETAHDLRMALVFVGLFLVAATVFRTEQQIERALLVVFLVGCAEAGIALLQILTLTRQIHWGFGAAGGVATSGSFINHSHFSQFMNLTLGAGIALLLVQMKRDSRRERDRRNRMTELQGGHYLRYLTGIVLCTVVVFTSMSRNGVISLLIAAGIVGVLLFRRKVLDVRGWLMGMIPWCVLVVLFLTCFDTVYDRFAVLEDREQIDVRLEMTSGTLRAWSNFPWWGAGLGTHEYVFPMYDRGIMSSMAEHADNDWAQLLEEFGLLGAAAVLAFVISVATIAVRLMFFGRTSLSTASFGLVFGLLATAWHSLSDFGQHLPGVFCVTAVVSGLLLAIARYEASKAKVRRKKGKQKVKIKGVPRERSSRLPLMIASLCLPLVAWWAIAGAFRAYQGEAWNSVSLAIIGRLQAAEWEPTDQHYADLLAAAENAAAAEPSNVKLGHLLNYYRWRSMSRISDPDTGNILLEPESLPFVERIADELASLRTNCPVYGPLYSLEGELRLFVLQQQAGARLIEHAAKLIPYDAGTNFLTGQLLAQQGRPDDAVEFLDRSVALNSGLFGRVAMLYLDQFQRPELAEQLAGDDYGRIVHLAGMMEQLETAADLSARGARLRDRALSQLRELVAQDEASAQQIVALATIEINDGQPEVAIPLYRRALAVKYGQINWRLALARALQATGEYEQALHEARICLRLRPDHATARNLLEDLSVQIEASPNETSEESE